MRILLRLVFHRLFLVTHSAAGLGVHSGAHQPQGFRKARHQVDVLQGGACLPLHQVVDVRDDAQTVHTRIHAHHQVAEVGSLHAVCSDGGLGTVNAHEGRILVKLPIERHGVLLGEGFVHLGIQRAHDAAAEREHVSREGKAHILAILQGKFALHFADVLVPGELVGVHVLVARGIVEGGRQLFASPGNTGLAVTDHTEGVKEARMGRRRQSQNATARKAPGIAHHRRGLDGLPVKLGKAVGSLSKQFRRGVHGVFPVTGQPLPLISKGGTSTVINCVYLGIILSVSRSAKKKRSGEADKVEAENENSEQIAEAFE